MTSSLQKPPSVWVDGSRPSPVQIFWSSHSQDTGLYTPVVHATGRWLSASGKSVYHATQSSMPHGLTSAGPVEVFGPLQSSGRAQILMMPPLRLATATARPSTLTEVRDGLP